MEEIARERNLTRQTNEGHLAYYVFTGEIEINELVSREKFILKEPVVRNLPDKSIKPVKEKLGNDVSYSEIRLVMAWLDGQKAHRPI